MDVLTVKNLSVSFYRPSCEIEAVKNASFSLQPGEILVIMGDTGCGKSVLCKSIVRLLPDIARIKSGQILFQGKDITHYSEREMQKLRGNAFSMVFQNPMTALNPCMSVGAQIAEAVRLRKPQIARKELQDEVAGLMELVGLDCPEKQAKQYPHQFSGGMAQRCVTAIALAADPDVLFADEPTTALDGKMQEQILELFLKLREKLGMAVIFITHNPHVAARIADRAALMRAGEIYRIGDAEEILEKHIYDNYQ